MARIGKLRYRLTVERPSRTQDGGGGASVAWTSVAQIWGAVETSTGSESVSADRVTGIRQTVITVRHRDDIAPAMRFRLDDRLFPIHAALDPDGRRRFLRCMCEERDL